MKARTFKLLTNDIYKVTIYTEEWSQNDLDLMTKFGEPEIDLGGDFTVPTFTLANDLAKIKSDSPFNMSFDVNDFADAKDRADSWATEMLTRLTALIAILRGNEDEFSGEEVTTI